ncbi:MAG TPA: hypothetical protein DCQ36_05670 [Actinobacteria bacterium]|jgi:hypothetical protein|nr:hypothetical protein [Actinomycetota bacterium]
MPTGPLIPGLEEFDRPKRGWPRWLTALVLGLVALVVLVIVAGFIGGVGPLRILGQSSVPLTPVAYRSTDSPQIIEVAVTVPSQGLCRSDDLEVVAYERGSRIEVEGSVIRPRSASCQAVPMGGDLIWVPASLDAPLGSRTVISIEGRTPLPDRSAG